MATTTSRQARRWIVIAALAALLAAAAIAGIRVAAGSDPVATADAVASSVPSETAGELAPDVTFTTADGEQASLADYRGQPLVLNFWASWCPPCVAEMGDALRPVHEAHGDEVAFLGVNLRDEPDAAQRIVDATGVTYDLALDPDGAVFAAFGGLGMPTTVFIDRDGRIVEQHTGAITRDQLEAQVMRVLGA